MVKQAAKLLPKPCTEYMRYMTDARFRKNTSWHSQASEVSSCNLASIFISPIIYVASTPSSLCRGAADILKVALGVLAGVVHADGAVLKSKHVYIRIPLKIYVAISMFMRGCVKLPQLHVS